MFHSKLTKLISEMRKVKEQSYELIITDLSMFFFLTFDKGKLGKIRQPLRKNRL